MQPGPRTREQVLSAPGAGTREQVPAAGILQPGVTERAFTLRSNCNCALHGRTAMPCRRANLQRAAWEPVLHRPRGELARRGRSSGIQLRQSWEHSSTARRWRPVHSTWLIALGSNHHQQPSHLAANPT